MSHDYHEGQPGFSPAQILKDGCAECTYRSENTWIAVSHLDPVNFARAWARAAAYERGELADVSKAEVPLLRALWAVELQLRNLVGWPLGVVPTDEEWRPVVGHEGRYAVSDHGRACALFSARGYPPPPRFLKPQLSDGYVTVYLSTGKRGSGATRTVHVLVLEAFRGPRPGPEIEGRHLNGNRGDCYLSNLAWGTSAENSADAIAHGTTRRGERHGRAKLTEDQAREIKALLADGTLLQQEIADRFGVSFQLVSLIKRGKIWRHVQLERRGFAIGAVPCMPWMETVS